MRYIKLPLTESDYERLASIATAHPDKPSLPNLAIQALNHFLQLREPIPLSKRVGNPTGNKGRPIKQPKRKPKGETQ